MPCELPGAATDLLLTCFNWPQLTCAPSQHTAHIFHNFCAPLFCARASIVYNFKFNLLKRKRPVQKILENLLFQSNFSFFNPISLPLQKITSLILQWIIALCWFLVHFDAFSQRSRLGLTRHGLIFKDFTFNQKNAI